MRASPVCRPPSYFKKKTRPLRRRVLRECGVPDDAQWLRALRTATQRHPELSDVPLYVRHNRAERGLLRAGDGAPDAPVNWIYEPGPPTPAKAPGASTGALGRLPQGSGCATSLHALADASAAAGRLLVLACGSYS